ncbi:MAG: TetR/AcrR family transcriptional regulator [Aquabacterium sp.]
MDVKPRGRPRRYDPEVVLRQGLETFWRKGYAATSVDDLCLATGLNKPSLYAAWGDKQQWYRQALQVYVKQVGEGMALALNQARLHDALEALLRQAVSLYRDGRGCFMVTTAPSVAWDDDMVRHSMAAALAAQDQALCARFEQAIAQGDAGPAVSAQGLAVMVSALLHSLALRARVGEPETALLQCGLAGLSGIMAAARSGRTSGVQ